MPITRMKWTYFCLKWRPESSREQWESMTEHNLRKWDGEEIKCQENGPREKRRLEQVSNTREAIAQSTRRQTVARTRVSRRRWRSKCAKTGSADTLGSHLMLVAVFVLAGPSLWTCAADAPEMEGMVRVEASLPPSLAGFLSSSFVLAVARSVLHTLAIIFSLSLETLLPPMPRLGENCC